MVNSTVSGSPLQAVPYILQTLNRWIRWRRIDGDKRPVWWNSGRPSNSAVNRAEWRSFQAATATPVVDGIGFTFAEPVVLANGEQMLAFDLDACRDKDTGVIEPWAEDFLTRCNRSYTEVTPSGQGLRTWLAVRKLPHLHHAHFAPVAMSRAPGTTKEVECQVFGGGNMGFVTVTGAHLEGTSDQVETVDNLDWWPEVFGAAIDIGADSEPIDLSVGLGDPPTMDEIKAYVAQHEEGRLLMERAWFGHPELKDRWRTNSHGFGALGRLVVKGARWHGQEALKFVLRECPRWSDSGVDEKYSSSAWVAKDLGRTAVSKPAFTAMPPEPAAAPTTAAIDTGGLLVPAGEFARGAAQQLFLVKNLIARTGVTQFFGDPASGKTPFVMSLAITVANGAATWFGRKVMRKGVVIYMVGEDRAGVGHRLLAECKARGIDPDELGKTLLFTTKPGQLMSAEDTQRWVLAIQRAAAGREVALVVVDTQAQNFGPGDENAFKDMNQFLHNLEAMTGVLDCAIAMVHHTGHMNKDRGRGHSAMEGFLTSRFEVVKSELENGTVVTTASDHKHKNWEKPEPLRGTLVPVVRYTDEDGEVVTAITLQEQGVSIFDNEDDVVAVVKALVDRGAETSIRALAAAVDRHHRDVVKALRKAVTAGLISESKGKGGKISYPVTALGLEAVCKGSVQVRQNGWRTPNSEVSAPSEMAHLGAPKLDKSVTDALD